MNILENVCLLKFPIRFHQGIFMQSQAKREKHG